MKKLFQGTSLILLTLSLFSCDGRRIKGSGHVSTSTQKTGSYSEIEVKGPMDVLLTQGPEKEAVIEGDDNLIPYVELVEEGDKLIIRLKEHLNVSFHNDLKVRLSAPHVRVLSLSGSGSINLVNTLESEESLKLHVSGSGNIEGAVHAPEVSANITGSGNVDASGETRNLNVNIAGSGSFAGKSLLSENADVNIAGSGDADVHASVKLNAKIVGSGDVNYLGNPEISRNIIGSGSIRKKD